MRHTSNCVPVTDADNQKAFQPDECYNHGSGVYFCGICYHVLITDRYGMDVDEIKRLLDYDCPSCNSPILKNLNYREGYTPISFEDSVQPNFSLKHEYSSEKKVVFQPATVLRGFRSHLPSIDRYVGELRPGWFSIFYGSKFSNQLAERYSFRKHFPINKGRFIADTIFIDTGNSFDPYFIALLARQHHKDPIESLDRIVISRAFTCYELVNLISELPRLLDTYGAKVVVFSDILTLFNEDVKKRETETILRDIRRRITNLCDDNKTSIIATICHRNKELEHLLFPYSDVLMEFKERNRSLHSSLHRHPVNLPVDFSVKQPERKCTLDNFPLEVQ